MARAPQSCAKDIQTAVCVQPQRWAAFTGSCPVVRCPARFRQKNRRRFDGTRRPWLRPVLVAWLFLTPTLRCA
eukprot:7762940-Lingulodinium_polyedra.AAC.1